MLPFCAPRHVLVMILMAILGLSGCAITPIPTEPPDNPSLMVINKYYRQTIYMAQQHPQQRWRHGRWGNMVVNLTGYPNLGLCYHWQNLVYQGIKPALEITGWEVVGIATNEGTRHEHHAVLVYNPEIHNLHDLLRNLPHQSVYILDPWPTGTAAIYSLSEWLHWPGQKRLNTRLTLINKNNWIEQNGS